MERCNLKLCFGLSDSKRSSLPHPINSDLNTHILSSFPFKANCFPPFPSPSLLYFSFFVVTSSSSIEKVGIQN
jgi:hypothetical protein